MTRDWPEDDEILDQHYDPDEEPMDDPSAEPTTRLSPTAREHLSEARAKLAGVRRPA